MVDPRFRFQSEFTRHLHNLRALPPHTEPRRVISTKSKPHTTCAGPFGSAVTSKRDRAWYATIDRAANDTAHKAAPKAYGALPGQGAGGADMVGSVDVNYFVPKQAQTFGYDYAGNMTNDSVWDYTYDAENRLVSMQTRSEVIGSGMLADSDRRRLEFTYDYLGRRVQKVVKKWNGSSYGTVDSSRKYLYDGWNLVAEFDAKSSLTLVRSYTWGLDLTGSLTDSGGVGALLQVWDKADKVTARTWLPTYDGNGNVVSLLDAEAGGTASVAAVFEYGPFGEPLRTQINIADASEVPFRFSTKFMDVETGLAYYGLRYYSPVLGRFINRDPIEEQGGLNLYGFVRNDGVNRWDFLGRYELTSLYNFRPMLWNGFDIKLPPIQSAPYGKNPPGIITDPLDIQRFLKSVLKEIKIWSNDNGSAGSSTDDNPTKEDQERQKKKCENLLAQMNDLSAQFSRLTFGVPATNPMSGSELKGKLKQRALDNVGGLFDALSTLTPMGLITEIGGYAGATTQLAQNATNGYESGSSAAADAGQYMASTSII